MKATGLLSLLALAAESVRAQHVGPVEITQRNFNQAAQMPVAWLFQLESPWSAQGRAAASLLQPVMLKAARYYNEQLPARGVRVGRIDMQNAPELRAHFCDSNVCPPLILYKGGRLQSYKGSGSFEDIMRFVERTAPRAGGGDGSGITAGGTGTTSAATYRAEAAAAAQKAMQGAGAAGLSGAASTRRAPSSPQSNSKEALARWLKEQAQKTQQPPTASHLAGASSKGLSAAPPHGRKLPQKSVDRNRDGTPDMLYEDTDGDGRYDVIYEDKDGDGIMESMHEDSDGDGRPDTLHVDTNGDGSAVKRGRT
jgi:hypothetical protein